MHLMQQKWLILSTVMFARHAVQTTQTYATASRLWPPAGALVFAHDTASASNTSGAQFCWPSPSSALQYQTKPHTPCAFPAANHICNIA